MPVLVPTAGQHLAVNGTDLSQYAVIADSLAPLMGVAARRGKNVVVPGRHGTIRTPRKRFDEHDIVLKCWLLGAQPDGTVPSNSTAAKQLYANADALLEVFAADTVTLTRTMPDGTQRQAVAEVTDKLDWTRDLGQAPLLAQVSIGLVLPTPFWFDVSPVTQTITGVAGVTATLSSFAAANAPMTDLTITFVGPISNPQLSAGPRYVQWNGVVASGQQVQLSTATWAVSPGTGTTWAPDLRNVSFSPGPFWLELDPTTVPFQATLAHTTGGSASVTIAGKRAYLSA